MNMKNERNNINVLFSKLSGIPLYDDVRDNIGMRDNNPIGMMVSSYIHSKEYLHNGEYNIEFDKFSNICWVYVFKINGISLRLTRCYGSYPEPINEVSLTIPIFGNEKLVISEKRLVDIFDKLNSFNHGIEQ